MSYVALIALIAVLYSLGIWNIVYFLLKSAGLVFAAAIFWSLYTAISKSQESLRLRTLVTPADKYGIFKGQKQSREGRFFILSSTWAWEEYSRVRVKERLPLRKPPLLVNAAVNRPKSNASFVSEDMMSPNHPEMVKKYYSIIDQIVSLIVRDFISNWWYKISKEPLVPNRIEYTLLYLVAEVSKRFERLDFSLFIISKVFPIFTGHIKEYRKAERLFRGERLQRNITDTDELDFLLARCYNSGKLHPALSTTPNSTLNLELSYLRKRANSILSSLLPNSEKNSAIIVTIVREILVCKVLQPTMDLFADPDTWNQILEKISDTMIQQENSLAKKINEVLERHDKSDDDFVDSLDNLRPPSFDEYVTQIKKCDNLLDALRIRDTINNEIHKKRNEIDGFGTEDIVHGMKVSDARQYISRLMVAQKKIDKRIKALGGKTLKIPILDMNVSNKTPKLIDVLENPHLLSAFAEFMDSRKRLIHLQFWMTSNNILQQISFEGDEIKFGTGYSEDDLSDSLLRDDTKHIFESFFLQENPWIPLDEQDTLLLEIRECYLKLSSQSMEQKAESMWIQVLEKARDTVFNQMSLLDYPIFMSSPAFAKLSANWSAETNLDFIEVLEELPRVSGESENSRRSLDMEEDRVPRKPFKVPNVFKKIRKGSLDALNSDKKIRGSSEEVPRGFMEPMDVAKTPSRKDATDNIEGELESILHVEDNLFNGLKKNYREKPRDSDEFAPSDLSEQSSPLFKSLKPRNLFVKKSKYSTKDSRKGESGFSSDALESQENIMGSSSSPVLKEADVLENWKKQYQETEAEYEAIKTQILSLENGDQDTPLARQLKLMKTGLEVELMRLKSQRKDLEALDLDYLFYPKRFTISINEPRTMPDSVKSGKVITVYPIQITTSQSDFGTKVWTVYRRYSEFEMMHAKLKLLHPFLSQYEFPGKIFKGLLQMKKQMIETRRKGLEKYLQNIMMHDEVCRNEEFRKFLCNDEILKHLEFQKSNNVEISYLPLEKYQVPDAPLSSATSDLPSVLFSSVSSPRDENLDFYDSQKFSATDSVVDLFIELFELKEKNNWLRRQAVVILLQQLFGGTVERRVMEALAFVGQIEFSVSSFTWIKDLLWQNDLPLYEKSWIVRNAEQKKKTKVDTLAKLVHLAPDLLGGIVGKANAKKGGERLIAIFQNRRLNQQLMYSLFDELVLWLFPDLIKK